MLGSEKGTFYASEQALTLENAENLKAMILAGNGKDVVSTVLDFSVRGRTPKQDTLVFALAMVIKLAPDAASRSAAYDAVVKVCRTPASLFQLLEFEKLFGGKPTWGAGKRRAVSAFYTARSADELAYLVTKYKSRNNWDHRDILRCSHISLAGKLPEGVQAHPVVTAHDLVLRYAVRGYEAIEGDVNSVLSSAELVVGQVSALETSAGDEEGDGFELVPRSESAATDGRAALARIATFLQGLQELTELGQFEGKPDEAKCDRAAELIRKHRMVREHVPTIFLGAKAVWKALLEKMPMGAMVRNLGKMSSIGLLDSGSEESLMVCSALADRDRIRRSRLHPFSILLAMETYRSGRGLRGSLSWPVNHAIIEALSTAFDLAFENVQPTGKKFLIGLDVSGSMGSPCAGSSIPCRTAAAAMALSLVRTEDQVRTMAFCDSFVNFPIGRSEPLDSVVSRASHMPFGGTDCSLPMLHALERRLEVDVFVVFTDSETWAGRIHASEALKLYRQQMRRPAKLVVAAFSSSGFTIADPEDAGMLDVVGLDASLPAVLKDFVEREVVAV